MKLDLDQIKAITAGAVRVQEEQDGIHFYRFTKEQFHHMWSTNSEMSMYILTVHCERLLRSGDDKIDSECMFLREKVFRLIQQNLNDQNYFLYTKDILAEMAGVSVRSLNRSLSELKELRLISVASGAIRLKV